MNLLLSILFFLFKANKTVKHPPILVIVVTTDCNYRCVMCWRNGAKAERNMIDYQNPMDMDFDVLKGFLEEHGKYISLVRVHGGEPLFHKDIAKLFDLLHTHKTPYNIATNGSLLTEDIARQLVKKYCVGVGFSLDTGKADNYENIRKGGTLETVSENIKTLNKIKKENKTSRPVLSASMVTFSYNMNDMMSLIQFCKDHEIPALSISEGDYHQTDGLEEEHLIKNNKEEAYKAIKEASAEGKRQKMIVRFRFPSLSGPEFGDLPFHEGNVKPKNCLNLYASTWLLPNFDIITCSSAKSVFGKYTDGDFAEVWNAPEHAYSQCRESFRKSTVPHNCSGCCYTGGFFS